MPFKFGENISLQGCKDLGELLGDALRRVLKFEHGKSEGILALGPGMEQYVVSRSFEDEQQLNCIRVGTMHLPNDSKIWVDKNGLIIAYILVNDNNRVQLAKDYNDF